MKSKPQRILIYGGKLFELETLRESRAALVNYIVGANRFVMAVPFPSCTVLGLGSTEEEAISNARKELEKSVAW